MKIKGILKNKSNNNIIKNKKKIKLKKKKSVNFNNEIEIHVFDPNKCSLKLKSANKSKIKLFNLMRDMFSKAPFSDPEQKKDFISNIIKKKSLVVKYLFPLSKHMSLKDKEKRNLKLRNLVGYLSKKLIKGNYDAFRIKEQRSENYQECNYDILSDNDSDSTISLV